MRKLYISDADIIIECFVCIWYWNMRSRKQGFGTVTTNCAAVYSKRRHQWLWCMLSYWMWFLGAMQFFNKPPPDAVDTQTEQTAFRNDRHNSSSTITWSSYPTHQRPMWGVPDAHASDLHSVESERKHHLTETRRERVISAGCMEAVKTWKYHWSGRTIDRNT